MNKQQLANKIWASANKMRSKIDANEYKDYILGLIFYKFLCDNEEQYLRKDGWTDEDMPFLVEDYEDANAKDTIEYCKNNIGYFIEYKYLFSTWLKPDSMFNVADLSAALNNFDRLVSANYRSVYEKIFLTLQAGLSKLGENPASQTRALKDLIKLIKDIPTDGSQDYDVLGYVYEYLIGNFAANAGKKAGEFYTPHEVAILMSEIVAEHHKAKETIEIYDPTSGSGSLLITIGKSVGRHIEDKNKVKYYAQELKENTYNLTRMNLVMRGIKPNNINARCADSLDHIRQCRETTTLVAIPESVTIRQDTSQCTPFQQIITFGYPCLVSTPVQSALTIINHVGHIPLIPFAEHGRTVYFMLVVGRSYSQPIFIRSLGFLINLLHARLRNFTLGVCSQ